MQNNYQIIGTQGFYITSVEVQSFEKYIFIENDINLLVREKSKDSTSIKQPFLSL